MPTLRLGSTGVYVKMLQLALQRAGFDTGKLDGIFGNFTQGAVISFQRQNGLLPDGIVGMLTWSQLKPYFTGYVTHRVVRGETLWLLAEQYNTTVSAIRTANPDIDPFNLQVGTRLVIPLGFPVVPTDIEYTYSLVAYIIEGLAMRYPFIRTGTIGTSVMGRQLLYTSIGSGTNQVFYNASHHANEWITTPVLLKYLEELAYAYTSNGKTAGYSTRSLLSEHTLYMVPLVNPDGVDLVNGAVDESSEFFSGAKAISEKYPSIPFPSGWKANISGTDLNLNYPASWEEAKKIKYEQGFTSPAPRDFVGTAPLSARESRAVYDFTLQHEFKLILAYHTQGEVIYWKYLNYNPENSEAIANAFAKVSGYTPELTPYESAYAGYKDWFIQTFNLPGCTIEAGRGVNPLPISDFDRIYRDNVGILTLGMALSKQ